MDGIYYLVGDAFPIQLIISHQLSKRENYWMQNLQKDLKSGGEIEKLIENYEEKKVSELYQAVMDVVVRANWKETEAEKAMCEALRELFADELQESEEKGIEQGVKALIETCVDFGASRKDTQARIEKKFSLTEQVAQEYLKKFWVEQ